MVNPWLNRGFRLGSVNHFGLPKIHGLERMPPAMAHAVKARLVSGEIMAATPGVRAGGASGADIIDAEFETLVDEVAFGARPAPANTQPARLVVGMDALKRNGFRSAGRQRGGLLFWAAGLTLVACAFWLSGGHVLVHGDGSQDIGMANTLRIVDVTSSVVKAGGRPFLSVDGAAINEGQAAARLPGIEINVTGNSGRITRYNLGTSDRPLAPGQRFAFSSRLEVPKDGVRTVVVDFREDSVYAGGERQGY
jgi:hypothetical protein